MEDTGAKWLEKAAARRFKINGERNDNKAAELFRKAAYLRALNNIQLHPSPIFWAGKQPTDESGQQLFLGGSVCIISLYFVINDHVYIELDGFLV